MSRILQLHLQWPKIEQEECFELIRVKEDGFTVFTIFVLHAICDGTYMDGLTIMASSITRSRCFANLDVKSDVPHVHVMIFVLCKNSSANCEGKKVKRIQV